MSNFGKRRQADFDKLKAENERLYAQNGYLRAKLLEIRDDVPKVDIHFQGKIAIDIAAVALATDNA